MTWQPQASVATLIARDRLLKTVRAFFAERDVIEVQTPMLGRHTVTDVHVESIAVPGYGYLQTSPEYFMKRLLAAGVPSCFQLASAFRADETGRLHNPEFTMLEWYRLAFDHQDLMKEVAALVDAVLGSAPVTTVSYGDLVNIDLPQEAQFLAFDEACRALQGRTFITDYPADQAALARLNPDGHSAARFELVIDGVEIANGYWELLDANEHRQRFSQDVAERDLNRQPPIEPDADFLYALDSGLPSCAGVALGLDRLFMLARGADSLDEVLTFR